jgi:hypothetical protein
MTTFCTTLYLFILFLPGSTVKKMLAIFLETGKSLTFFTVYLATRPPHPLFWLGFDSRRTSYCDLKWQNLSDLLPSWQNQEGFENARILRFHSTKAVCFHFRPCGSKTTFYYLTRTMNTVLACCGCPG